MISFSAILDNMDIFFLKKVPNENKHVFMNNEVRVSGVVPKPFTPAEAQVGTDSGTA